MDKMRWFIIGNLIGFGVLIVGIGFNESLKRRADATASDVQNSSVAAQNSGNTDSAPKSGNSIAASAASSVPVTQESGSGNSTLATDTDSSRHEKVKTTKILAATRDISKGTILHAGDVEIRTVDSKVASRDGFNSCEDALGQKTKIDLVEGEMLQPSDLEAQ